MPDGFNLHELTEHEFTEALEEGKAPDAVEALRPAFEAAGDDAARLADVCERLQALPVRDDFGFDEPSDLAGIRALRDAAPRDLGVRLCDDGLGDRMLGTWLGRCAGCALGKPVEGFMRGRDGKTSRQLQRAYLRNVSPDEWPLRDYFPQRSGDEQIWCRPSTREHIAYMESDDDLRYTVLGQKVFAQCGRGFDSRDMARLWLNDLPIGLTYTAETQAYANLVSRYPVLVRHRAPAVSVDWGWVAHHHNPYREWIGAAIRADSFGYAAPGLPELAAEFAWRDARISHAKNGIYGEMFNAAMIAAAFALFEPRDVVEAGLAEIPRTSRLHREMRRVIDLCDAHDCAPGRFEEVFDAVESLLGHYHPVHTNNNAALVVAALLLGERDLGKTIALAVMGGWDTDCNGATAGSILGALVGAARLDDHWTGRLNDTLYSLVAGYHPIAISECARRSAVIARAVAAGHDGPIDLAAVESRA